jgi:hypothetical protein
MSALRWLVSAFQRWPELLPLTIYVVMAVVAGFQMQPGKVLYWVGAFILTIGILLMKG